MGEGSGSPAAGRGWADRPAIIVSACLLGVPCNHLGRASPSAATLALSQQFQVVPICPEVAGGLPIPRPAAERLPDGSVRTLEGTDVTPEYERGAERAVTLARIHDARRAVLKARSPSCGCHEIYDGSFTRRRVPGEGMTAEALRRAGVEVCSEEDAEAGGIS